MDCVFSSHLHPLTTGQSTMGYVRGKISYQDEMGDLVPTLPERITGPLEIIERQLSLVQCGYLGSPYLALSGINHITALGPEPVWWPRNSKRKHLNALRIRQDMS